MEERSLATSFLSGIQLEKKQQSNNNSKPANNFEKSSTPKNNVNKKEIDEKEEDENDKGVKTMSREDQKGRQLLRKASAHIKPTSFSSSSQKKQQQQQSQNQFPTDSDNENNNNDKSKSILEKEAEEEEEEEIFELLEDEEEEKNGKEELNSNENNSINNDNINNNNNNNNNNSDDEQDGFKGFVKTNKHNEVEEFEKHEPLLNAKQPESILKKQQKIEPLFDGYHSLPVVPATTKLSSNENPNNNNHNTNQTATNSSNNSNTNILKPATINTSSAMLSSNPKPKSSESISLEFEKRKKHIGVRPSNLSAALLALEASENSKQLNIPNNNNNNLSLLGSGGSQNSSTTTLLKEIPSSAPSVEKSMGFNKVGGSFSMNPEKSTSIEKNIIGLKSQSSNSTLPIEKNMGFNKVGGSFTMNSKPVHDLWPTGALPSSLHSALTSSNNSLHSNHHSTNKTNKVRFPDMEGSPVTLKKAPTNPVHSTSNSLSSKPKKLFAEAEDIKSAPRTISPIMKHDKKMNEVSLLSSNGSRQSESSKDESEESDTSSVASSINSSVSSSLNSSSQPASRVSSLNSFPLFDPPPSGGRKPTRSDKEATNFLLGISLVGRNDDSLNGYGSRPSRASGHLNKRARQIDKQQAHFKNSAAGDSKTFLTKMVAEEVGERHRLAFTDVTGRVLLGLYSFLKYDANGPIVNVSSSHLRSTASSAHLRSTVPSSIPEVPVSPTIEIDEQVEVLQYEDRSISFEFLLLDEDDNTTYVQDEISKTEQFLVSNPKLFQYDPDLLEDADLKTGKHKTVLNLGGCVASFIPYVDPKQLKQDLNREFQQRHPEIPQGITHSKIRKIKKKLLDIGREARLELPAIAISYVYLEKLLLQALISKETFELAAAVCLILAAKFNGPYQEEDYILLKETLATGFQFEPKNLSASEFYVFSKLSFSLFVDRQEMVPHWQRLKQQLDLHQ